FPGCDNLPSSPDPMVKKQAVFAFLMAMSIEPTQASSMRMKARKLAPESTMAIHILVLRLMASLRAAAMAFSADSKSICMDWSPMGRTGTRPLNTYHASAVPGRKRLACRDNMPARGNAARMAPVPVGAAGHGSVRLGEATKGAPSFPSAALLCDLLQSEPNPPVLEQGCANEATSSRPREHRSEARPRRPASSLRSNLIYDRDNPAEHADALESEPR